MVKLHTVLLAFKLLKVALLTQYGASMLFIVLFWQMPDNFAHQRDEPYSNVWWMELENSLIIHKENTKDFGS